MRQDRDAGGTMIMVGDGLGVSSGAERTARSTSSLSRQCQSKENTASVSVQRVQQKHLRDMAVLGINDTRMG